MLLQKINNKCGFTLIELLIVIFIIGAALAFAIPTFMRMMDDVNTSERTQITQQTEKMKDMDNTIKTEEGQKL